ncbi:helix-turn-helix transcriptional regulator [Herbiconiux moechotypicola]|uniref:Transcription regulator PadR N-terminal domain-containing protein n=1 Tax=Herbiconiux moechotypicola TaxID=637393 RepID=A0ABP5Q2U8_9MICO|nr:helix-turn-helix transcriptional regulator [Herbiconiux moechotypicola]MCS5728174.1 helix-turn-helix transcriptional regulator [Herbiconiux moechotypicola]
MDPLSRLTPATVDVLRILLEEGGELWGLAVVKRSGRPAGSVYPILERLEGAGWVESAWEADSERNGPRRRLYRFCAEGADAAREAVDRFERVARRERPRSAPRAPLAPAHGGALS